MKVLSVFTFLVFVVCFSYKLLLPGVDKAPGREGEQIEHSSFFDGKKNKKQLKQQMAELEEFAIKKIEQKERQEELADMEIILEDLNAIWERNIFASRYNLTELRNTRNKIKKMKDELQYSYNQLDGLDILQIYYLLIVERMSLDEISTMETPSLQVFLNLTDKEWMNTNDYLASTEFRNRIQVFKGMEPRTAILQGETIKRDVASSEKLINDFGSKLEELENTDQGYEYDYDKYE